MPYFLVANATLKHASNRATTEDKAMDEVV
jgi:hypothetical protein